MTHTDFADWATLAPGTIFMSNRGNDDELHQVDNDRDHNDPFLIRIGGESLDRVYWLGGHPVTGETVTYSVYKKDVSPYL